MVIHLVAAGYGDIHAVNVREMIFVMIYVSFDMILGAYLIGNMTALIVKGSKTERYRDKMTDLMKYMNRNRLGKEVRNQIKGHLRLQYESSYTDAAVLQDIPISIRAKVIQENYFCSCPVLFVSSIEKKIALRKIYCNCKWLTTRPSFVCFICSLLYDYLVNPNLITDSKSNLVYLSCLHNHPLVHIGF